MVTKWSWFALYDSVPVTLWVLLNGSEPCLRAVDHEVLPYLKVLHVHG